MGIRDVKVMHPVAEFSSVRHDVCTGASMQLKIQAVLVAFAAWLDVYFHDTFAERVTVAKACRMADGVIHLLLSSDVNTPLLRAATLVQPGLSLCCTAGCEGDLNWIGNISLVETTMNKRAQPLDTLQVLVHIATENLLNLVVVERCTQAPDKTFDTSRMARAGSFRNRLKRPLHHRASETYRTRSFGVQKQEFSDMSRVNHRSIDFAIRFKRGTGTQQSYPAHVVKRLALILGLLRPEHREMRVQQGSCGCGAFLCAPDANKMPALAVAHCRIGYALKKIYFFLHTVEEFMWFRKPHLFHTGSLYLQEEAG